MAGDGFALGRVAAARPTTSNSVHVPYTLTVNTTPPDLFQWGCVADYVLIHGHSMAPPYNSRCRHLAFVYSPRSQHTMSIFHFTNPDRDKNHTIWYLPYGKYCILWLDKTSWITDNISGGRRQGSAEVQPERCYPLQTGVFRVGWAVSRASPDFRLLAARTCL